MTDCKDENSTLIQTEEEIIKQTLISMWQAIEDEDMARYETFIHPDFTQFGETDSVLSVGKNTELKGVSSWVEAYDNIQTEMIEPKITVIDKVAWITYYWSDTSKKDGKEYSSKGKSTRIFVKENEQWLCIHGHYTLMP